MENTTEFFVKRVLIIDDNESDRYIADFLIRNERFSIETIQMESAPKALHYLNAFQGNTEKMPQLILLDIRMPEMDGFDFLNEFKYFPENVKSHITIVMLSSSLDPEDHMRIANNPAVHGFINKPLDKEKLTELRLQMVKVKANS